MRRDTVQIYIVQGWLLGYWVFRVGVTAFTILESVRRDTVQFTWPCGGFFLGGGLRDRYCIHCGSGGGHTGNNR